MQKVVQKWCRNGAVLVPGIGAGNAGNGVMEYGSAGVMEFLICDCRSKGGRRLAEMIEKKTGWAEKARESAKNFEGSDRFD